MMIFWDFVPTNGRENLNISRNFHANTCRFSKVLSIYDHVNTHTLLYCVSKPKALHKQIVSYHTINFVHLTHLASQIDAVHLMQLASVLFGLIYGHETTA